jgi:soluble lytic murein transglycosylase
MLTLSLFSYSAYANTSDNFELLQKQRELYQQARKALSAGHLQQFKKLRGQLTDYPLLMYLDYQQVSRRLYRLPSNQVKTFLEDYPNTVLAERLTRNWLTRLGKHRRWREFLDYYDPSTTRAELQCYYLRARWNTGDKSAALQETSKLWLVGKSQPKACDPLFKEWIDAGYATPELAWRRFDLAMQAGKVSLAKYLKRFLDQPEQQLADLFVKVHYSPQLLGKTDRYQQDALKPIVLHGLKRYARYNPKQAAKLWQHYQSTHQFDPNDSEALDTRLAIQLISKSNQQLLDWLAETDPNAEKVHLLEKRLTAAISLGKWTEVSNWVPLLPEHQRNNQQWQYWLAIALTETDQPEQAALICQELAQHRSYYGFLAADHLNQAYQMQDTPVISDATVLQQVATSPAILRAEELYALNQRMDARREWYHATQAMADEEVIAAGAIAQQWGWHLQSILAMVKAESWNDLDRRFPLAYPDLIGQAAKNTGLNANYLYAVARQESAFAEKAHSSAGAMGLLQLLPSTAKQTARKAGIPYRSRYELLEPEKNINLGSLYLSQLMQDFNNNRVLASAAYNAGPHRVKRWLTRNKDTMPLTNWIETIPFHETRQYVKNVLAFSVIYAYRQGETQALIQQHEVAIAGHSQPTLARAN